MTFGHMSLAYLGIYVLGCDLDLGTYFLDVIMEHPWYTFGYMF
jgi:hypothetical protein